jgi:hypothetical protein
MIAVDAAPPLTQPAQPFLQGVSPHPTPHPQAPAHQQRIHTQRYDSSSCAMYTTSSAQPQPSVSPAPPCP